MKQELKDKLLGLGLSEDQIGKLEAQGVNEDSDMSVFKTEEELSGITGAPLITNRKVFEAFKAKSTAGHDVTAEIPDEKGPTKDQINSFAAQTGMDAQTLMLMMMSGGMGNAGMGGLDISGMIPVPTIVAGYNPKIRNMFLMIMGTLENRLGVPLIVINDDGSVNKDLTIEYINGLEEGREAAEGGVYYSGEGVPHEIIKVGVDAQSIYDADPLQSTKALQQNGMGTGRINWKDVALEVRQVAYYAAMHTKEINVDDDSHLTWLRDNIKPDAKRFIFHKQMPKALSMFNEARRTGSLPTLRVMLTRSARRPETMPRRRSLSNNENL